MTGHRYTTHPSCNSRTQSGCRNGVGEAHPCENDKNGPRTGFVSCTAATWTLAVYRDPNTRLDGGTPRERTRPSASALYVAGSDAENQRAQPGMSVGCHSLAVVMLGSIPFA